MMTTWHTHVRIAGSMCVKFIGTGDFQPKWPVMPSFDDFFVAFVNAVKTNCWVDREIRHLNAHSTSPYLKSE